MASLPAHENLVRYFGSWTESRAMLELQQTINGEIAATRAAGSPHPSCGGSSYLPFRESLHSQDDDDESGSVFSQVSSEGSGVLAPDSLHLLKCVPTLCMQLELCAVPTLHVILQEEMRTRSSLAASPRAAPFEPPRVSPITHAGSPAARMPEISEHVPGGPTSRGSAGGRLGLEHELPSLPSSRAASVLHASMLHASMLHTPPHVRWRWIAGVARGLGVVHAAGWVHNDVKPANIFCGPDGQVQLADFGLATPILDETGARRGEPERTTGGDALVAPRAAPALSPLHNLAANALPHAFGGGTPTYMAPERQMPCADWDDDGSSRRQPVAGTHADVSHAANLTLSPASDTYSLGVCVAELHGNFSTAMERASVIRSLKDRAHRYGDLGQRAREHAAELKRPAIDLPQDDAWEVLTLKMLAPTPAVRPTTAHVQEAATRLAVNLSEGDCVQASASSVQAGASSA